MGKLAYWLILPLLLWGGFHLFFYIDTQEEERQVAKNKTGYASPLPSWILFAQGILSLGGVMASLAI